MRQEEFLYKEETYQILGACFEVYKGQPLKQFYKADFICFGRVIVEIKATDHLTDKDRSQLLNYLNATGFEVGLLINFGHHPQVEHERFILTKEKLSA